MATIRVQTTQNVSIEYEVASVADRIVAAILDNFILFSWFGITAGVLATIGVKEETLGLAIIALAGVPFVFYHLICEVFFNGQSLGKKARNIKVVRLDGTAPRLSDYLLRWLLRIVDTGIAGGLVAVITIAANGRGQRLGDLAAGTAVVSLKPVTTAVASPTAAVGARPDYQVVFPQAARLADHDVALIRRLANQAVQQHNFDTLHQIANRVKEVTGLQSDLDDTSFLQTVLRDHAHLAVNG